MKTILRAAIALSLSTGVAAADARSDLEADMSYYLTFATSKYLSDGDVNITLLPTTMGGRTRPAGFEHIGFSVEDGDGTRQRLLEAGATELNPVALGGVYYESKFRIPEGLVVDVGHWCGTSPLPAAEPAAAA